MSGQGVSSFRANLPNALALAVIILLAGILIQRRVLTPHPAPSAAALAAVPLMAQAEPLPGLRRIVLDPCTGLEKVQVQGERAKVD